MGSETWVGGEGDCIAFVPSLLLVSQGVCGQLAHDSSEMWSDPEGLVRKGLLAFAARADFGKPDDPRTVTARVVLLTHVVSHLCCSLAHANCERRSAGADPRTGLPCFVLVATRDLDADATLTVSFGASHWIREAARGEPHGHFLSPDGWMLRAVAHVDSVARSEHQLLGGDTGEHVDEPAIFRSTLRRLCSEEDGIVAETSAASEQFRKALQTIADGVERLGSWVMEEEVLVAALGREGLEMMAEAVKDGLGGRQVGNRPRSNPADAPAKASAICGDPEARAAELRSVAGRLGARGYQASNFRPGSTGLATFLATQRQYEASTGERAEVIHGGNPQAYIEAESDLTRRIKACLGKRFGAPAPFDAPVEVQPLGRRGGVAVFAARDVERGETLTHYCGSVTDTTTIGFSDYGTAIDGTSRYALVGDPEEARPWQCGQLANDGSAIFPDASDALPFLTAFDSFSRRVAFEKAGPADMGPGVYAETLAELVARTVHYAAGTCVRCNGTINAAWSDEAGGVVGTLVAGRDIRRGEEIVVSYGAGYWLFRAMAELRSEVMVAAHIALVDAVTSAQNSSFRLTRDMWHTARIDGVLRSAQHATTLAMAHICPDVLGSEWLRQCRGRDPEVGRRMQLLQDRIDELAKAERHDVTVEDMLALPGRERA